MTTKTMLLASAAAVYLGYRLFQNMRTKAGTGSLVKQLKKDPAVGETFAESLDISVQRTDIKNPDVATALQPYLAMTKNGLGDFVIKHIQQFNDGSYLFVTTTDYTEAIKAGRRTVESAEVHNLNFVLRTDIDKNQYVVYSDLYTDLADKNLRVDFAKALFELIQG